MSLSQNGYGKSGRIDKSEVKELLGDLKWGVDQNKLRTFMTAVFGDQKGNLTVISFEQFVQLHKAVIARQPPGIRKQQVLKDGEQALGKRRININDLRLLETDLRIMFNGLDAERKGYLSIADMRKVLEESGLPDPDGDQFETAVHEHMLIADKNKDGRVTFEEFVSYRNQMIDYCAASGLVEKAAPTDEEDPDKLQRFRLSD